MRTFVFAACILSGVSAAYAAHTVEWTYPLEADASAPTLFPNEKQPVGVLVASGKNLVCLKGNGAVLWKVTFEDTLATPAAAADLNGDGSTQIVCCLAGGAVVCLDEKGREQWRYALGFAAGGFKNVTAADVLPEPGLEILFGCDDGWLNCLSATGELRWRFWGDKFRVSPVAVGDLDADGVPEIVYGTDNGHVYCLNNAGQVKWRYDEFAPYGRSGPNIADLNGDGKGEVLITRSNVGNATCLIAIDHTGRLVWRTQDVMQGYVSNAVVDFENDGRLEVLHGDKGNYLYCENADGSRRWKVELGGRGLFWAPAVADIDGDGSLDAVAGLRGEDPVSGACVYVVGSDGTIEHRLDLGNGANAAPAIGDIDGDGQLEIVVSTQGPSQIQCISFGAAGRVAWPSLRGSSAMTACSAGVSQGKPVSPAAIAAKGEGKLQTGDVVWGDNTMRVTWSSPLAAGLFVELSAAPTDGVRRTWIADLKAGATEAAIPWRLASPETVTMSVRLLMAGNADPVFAASCAVTPREPEFCRFEEVERVCASALEAGKAARADTSGLHNKQVLLAAARDEVVKLFASGECPDVVADKATALRKRAEDLERLAGLLAGMWRSGVTGNFIFWQDANPWDTFDPMSVPAKIDMAAPIRFTAYKNELEDVALTLFNTTAETIDVRCVFTKPDTGQNWYKPEQKPADAFTLRRCVPVPSAWADRVFDALPELDVSRSITIPPGEGRQLWLVLRTHDLAPGKHMLTLYLGSLTKPPTFREVPIEVEVWPISLRSDIYAKINWCNIEPASVSDKALEYMKDHGLNVCYGPPLPSVPVDAKGNLAGAVDWTRFDEIANRVPRTWTFLWGAPPPREWPKGVNPKEDSPEYFNGFRTAIAELANHLNAIGIGYYNWAFYPIDEPWNTGFTDIPRLKQFAQMVKRADPKAQMYTDPAGLVRCEYLDEFKDLIDIWQPEANLLKRDPRLLEWFRKNAKRFWFYEAPGPAKNLKPLGHYRAYGWFAWHFGTEGSGYWVYKSLDDWWVTDVDWSAVYQTNNDIVPTRRSEADRDGIEDYRAFYVLNEEIQKARAAGHNAEADKAEALMKQAFDEVVGWQIGSIDEITRITREYELDFDLLLRYRNRIAEEILRLRALYL